MSAEPRLPSAAPSGPEPVLPSDGGAGGAGASTPVELPSARTATNGGEVGGPSSPPHAPQPAAVQPAGGETRADRIRAATARGLLGGGVPAQYEAEDWDTVRSADPFEVLYLDHRQLGAIGPAVLEERRDALRAFWSQKNDLRSRGAGTQRDAIERRYGGPDVARYAGNVERAYQRLADPADRAREAQALDDARRQAGEAQIGPLVDVALDDGLLTGRETTRVLQGGERAGLTPDEAADYLLRRLEQGGFAPRTAPGPVPHGGPGGAAFVLSAEWVSAERRADEEATAVDAAARAQAERERAREEARRAAEQAVDSRVPPIEFDQGSAHSLEQLVDMCDRYPAEARRYLATGAIEQWLGRAGKAGAVVEAADRRRAHSADAARALELFVRDLSRRIGRPDVPVLLPRPAAVVLGAVPQGARQAARIEFAREGRPFVWGTARLADDVPGVRVSPAFADDALGPRAAVEVEVDTTHAAPGDYATHVLVEPAGGTAVAVPLRFGVQPLTLRTDHPALDLGAVPLGGTRGGAIRLLVSPRGGRVAGTVALAQPHPGVTLSGGVGDEGGLAQVAVDARLTGPGVRYRSEVVFDTNAGVVRVPVSFTVRRASAEAARWAGGLAAAGGAGMWLARQLLVPGAGWHLSYSWASHAPSVVVACVTLGVVGRAAAALARRVPKR